ncbi:STAS domain-containing protein [Marinobacter halodurans]|uniref:STAS domain-containing protein n=1 Tax=Marinobacter halodurans TaxID=2528979 RepID=A0ABY1ZLK7_9GAMM|nr:STAS domain-containing protein [Marinobacter halodurans]TBW55436.1 STAS domain-containing protein [Marinobacter halodurans]
MSGRVAEIDCGQVFGIAEVADVYARLYAAIEENLDIKLDISRLERIDTAALQLLYGLERDAAAHGVRLCWSDPSAAFLESAGILGMPGFYRAPPV